MFLHHSSSHHLRSISSNDPQDPRAWFWRASRTCCAKGRPHYSPNAPHSQRLDGEWGSSSPARGPTYRYSILAGVNVWWYQMVGNKGLENVRQCRQWVSLSPVWTCFPTHSVVVLCMFKGGGLHLLEIDSCIISMPLVYVYSKIFVNYFIGMCSWICFWYL